MNFTWPSLMQSEQYSPSSGLSTDAEKVLKAIVVDSTRKRDLFELKSARRDNTVSELLSGLPRPLCTVTRDKLPLKNEPQYWQNPMPVGDDDDDDIVESEKDCAIEAENSSTGHGFGNNEYIGSSIYTLSDFEYDEDDLDVIFKEKNKIGGKESVGHAGVDVPYGTMPKAESHVFVMTEKTVMETGVRTKPLKRSRMTEKMEIWNGMSSQEKKCQKQLRILDYFMPIKKQKF